MLVKFQGSDDTFEIKDYQFSKPKCHVCETDEDTYGRTLDLWFCEEMRVFWCRAHQGLMNEKHNTIARCYSGDGTWHHPCLSGVVHADTE